MDDTTPEKKTPRRAEKRITQSDLLEKIKTSRRHRQIQDRAAFLRSLYTVGRPANDPAPDINSLQILQPCTEEAAPGAPQSNVTLDDLLDRHEGGNPPTFELAANVPSTFAPTDGAHGTPLEDSEMGEAPLGVPVEAGGAAIVGLTAHLASTVESSPANAIVEDANGPSSATVSDL
ncbi:hypothetical protein AURDEDRAFT_177489 [Auricularia subglabra TFB-10046 SS5]|uniref:Uncharacterized protein n=1 Tax=Auricularia subglabra (strain TFB-10046 / SS5) TaxID=717982 RepID=J0LAL1_AURST|nr:hypothetical protein AURDEDRAFT_177489 [Auricularia subglabra TFB-10046 SS5]